MAKQTLLELTQNILSRLDSDEVNSISDNTESLQVARIIENKYYDILARGDLPQQDVLFQLVASGDSTLPVYMTLPTGCSQVKWIKYFDSDSSDSQQVSQFGSYSHGLNTDLTTTSSWSTTSAQTKTIATGNVTFTDVASGLTITVGQGALISAGTHSMFGNVVSYSGTTLTINVTSTIGSGSHSAWVISSSPGASVPGYKYVTILPIDQFIDYINGFNPGNTNVYSYTFTEGSYSFTFYYRNDHQPTYCTILENNYVLFDTYNLNFDTTLQASKTLVYGQIITPFTQSDSFVPDLDDKQFPLLLNEATALAFLELKQMPHPKAEQEIKRQWSAVQKEKAVINKPSHFDALPSYGRVPRTGGFSSTGYGVYKWMRP